MPQSSPPAITYLKFSGNRAVYGVSVTAEWTALVADLDEYAASTYPKHHRALLFALSPSGRRRTGDLTHSTAAVIDADVDPSDLGDGFLPAKAPIIDTLLQHLVARGINFHYCARRRRDTGRFKFHLIIPYTEPVPIADARVLRCAIRRYCERFTGLPPQSFDRSLDSPSQLIYAYGNRPDDAACGGVDIIRHSVSDGSGVSPDMFAGGTVVPSKNTHGGVFDHVVLNDDKLWALLQEWDPSAVPSSKGVFLRCTALHKNAHASRTLYLPERQRIRCFDPYCGSLTLDQFFSRAPPVIRAKWKTLYAEAVADVLPPPPTRVSLAAAAGQIKQALGRVLSNGSRWQILRVTTGAGKTRAAVEQLAHDALTDAADDAPGSSILATYSNAKVREVARDLRQYGAPFRQRVGRLAVLAADGGPACRRYTQARALQDAGVDIHRALCLHNCEYFDGCPAVAGCRTGTGSLTVTNHALVPTLLRETEGFPRLFFDESPPLITEVTVATADLAALLTRLHDDATDSTGGITAAFSRFRIFDQALCRALDDSGLLSWLAQLVAHGPTYASDWWARRQSSLLGQVRGGRDAASHLRECLGRFSRDKTGGIRCPEQSLWQYRHILRAFSALEDIAEAGTIETTGDALIVTRFSAAALAWRERGGVIMDATAPVDEWRTFLGEHGAALEVVDIAVEDAVPVARTAVLTGAVGSRRLATDHETVAEWGLVVDKLRSVVGEGDSQAKTVLVTYRHFTERLQALFPLCAVHYFGELRGRNDHYEQGFTRFITIGDGRMNIDAAARYGKLLATGVSVDARAASELAQCHGRARSPVNQTECELWHFGKVLPLGWDAGNTTCVVL